MLKNVNRVKCITFAITLINFHERNLIGLKMHHRYQNFIVIKIDLPIRVTLGLIQYLEYIIVSTKIKVFPMYFQHSVPDFSYLGHTFIHQINACY